MHSNLRRQVHGDPVFNSAREGPMHSVNVAGYIAFVLVFSAFYMKDMVSLRVLAICSNVAFLVFAGSMHLVPVIILHAVLLPLNVWRLIALIERRRVRPARTNSDVAHGLMSLFH
jgi:hypothetical protein